MNPKPDLEITGTITKFNLESNPDGSAVMVAYVTDEDGKVGRCWLQFPVESARALKSAARDRLTDSPADPEPHQDEQAAALDSLPGFNFNGSAPVFGGSLVLGDSYGVTGGTVYGDLHFGGQADDK
ncbi:hypothetical protein [Streptomyces mirabilis]|uniref:hypothetical protein n=1 Tax=Streptomyces mirabilis TaxID=68239 RepID=UPI0036B1CECF